MRMSRSLKLASGLLLGALLIGSVSAQTATGPSIQIVYMGGDDCPPCRVWRALELPKLQKSEAFRRVGFHYVVKSIRSSIPPTWALPEGTKEFKEKLDIASNRSMGSPQTAILVNGVVYDYFWGTRSAEEFEKMILAIESGSKYPFQRCLQLYERGSCQKTAE